MLLLRTVKIIQVNFTACPISHQLQFGVVLDCPAISVHFWPQLMYTLDLWVNIVQVGLPNHPPSEPTFVFAIWFFLLVVVREFIQFGVVLDCPAISAHFWPQTLWIYGLQVGHPPSATFVFAIWFWFFLLVVVYNLGQIWGIWS